MNICIFCSAKDVAETYQQAAREMAQLIAQNGHTLVWGGSNVGLMHVIAESAQKAGGKISGVSVEYYRERAHDSADEMVFAPDLAARKIMIVEKSNAFITLVGGTGSLDEVMEVIELKKYQKHNKPVVILNTNGFYDGLKSQFQTMSDGGFLSTSLEETVRFADTPQEALDYVLSYKRD